jgi:hypothetical protein
MMNAEGPCKAISSHAHATLKPHQSHPSATPKPVDMVYVWCTGLVRIVYGWCTDIVRVEYAWCTEPHASHLHATPKAPQSHAGAKEEGRMMNAEGWGKAA